MKLKQLFSGALFAALAFCQLAFIPQSASAQQRFAAPVITGFDVAQVPRVEPGSELVFTLYGTPGGDARISIAGVPNQYILAEVEAGVYVGSYTIRRVDRLNETTDVTANLRLGNQVASTQLDESLVAGAPWRTRPGSVPTGVAPTIRSFGLAPLPRIEPGAEMIFALVGTPGGNASARVKGVDGKIYLNEDTPGNYSGSYTVKNRDRIANDAKVTADLRVGTRDAVATLATPLVAVGAMSAPQRAANLPVRSCSNCGTIEAINAIQVKGEGGYLGLIGGGLAGAILGSQVGGGSGRTAAQILGAAGGAYAGREIEKNVKKNTHYEVVTRLDSGGTQTITYETAPQFSVGQKVRVEGNALVLIP
jgi:outer membrane lipoprotein SlyB